MNDAPQATPGSSHSTSQPGSGDASPIIGIDLGTTNSLVAHCTEAGPVILESPDPGSARSLPSVVRLLASADGESPYTVEALGQAARDRAVEFPTTTLHSVKRLMGRSADDLADDLQHLPYPVVEGPQHTARIALPTASGSDIAITPQEVSAILLRELKRWAEAALGTDVTRAVITVPAYFDDAQRQATRDAGRLAGLQVLRIVNEPTAAALAYGLGVQKNEKQNQKTTLSQGGSIPLNSKLNPDACATPEDEDSTPKPETQNPKSQTVAIYDLGGGTFDVSVLRLQQIENDSGGGTIDQVLATDGDTHLGGDDLDQQLIQLFQNEIRAQLQQPDLDFPPATRQAFRSLAEQTKIKLSTEDQAQVEIDLGNTPGNGQTYSRTITRDEFESLITPFIDRTLAACQRALKNAKLAVEKIDRVILVGGSTRVPLVRERVAELFQTDPYTALNPDEVVALGASVQAAVLAGLKRDTLLLDVIPLSLGIETMGGAVAKLIVSNSTIPARATEMFSTYADGQTNVKIHVLQGERELVKDCRSLATFDLTGVPPMPAGLPKINVTFLVDANGILSVQAVEERSGRRAQIQVVPNHGLTREEITQIENDSFTHARTDMNAHRLIDLRLNAKLDLRNIQKQLDRFPPENDTPKKPTLPQRGSESDSNNPTTPDPLTLDPAYRAEIESHIQKVQTHIDTPDAQANADQFQQALHDLDHATLRLAELNIARTLRDEP